MTRLVDRIKEGRNLRNLRNDEFVFPQFCKSLHVTGLDYGGGQVIIEGSKSGDRYEADGYIYNDGKKSRRWCIDPRKNMSGKRMRVWPSRFADIASIQRLALRLENDANRQNGVVWSLLHKYHDAGIKAVTYREKGTPIKDGSLQYEIFSDRGRRGDGELTYSRGRTPPIVSLVDAVVARAYPEEGEVFHGAAERNSTLWNRLNFVARILDMSIRHRIGKATSEKVYLFEICGVHHVYASHELHPGYFEVKRIMSGSGSVIEKVAIE